MSELVSPGAEVQNVRHPDLKIEPDLKMECRRRFQELYPKWVDRYFRPVPRGVLQGEGVVDPVARVVRLEDGDDSISEGTGYGMLLTVHAGDRARFDQLLSYVRAFTNQNGVMSWRISADNRILDPNSATDGDLDIAYGLVLADAAWGRGNASYGVEARRRIGALLKHAVEPGTNVLKPGDVYGGSNFTNPSYIAPLYFRSFHEFTQDPKWLAVLERNQGILDIMRARGHTLPQKWIAADGFDNFEMGQDSINFEYDASRVPWRQANYLLRNRGESSALANTAYQTLLQVNRFFEIDVQDPARIVDGYTRDGKPIGKHNNATFVATAAISAMVSDNSEYRKRCVERLLSLDDKTYFNDHINMLAMLTLSGSMGMVHRVNLPLVGR